METLDDLERTIKDYDRRLNQKEGAKEVLEARSTELKTQIEKLDTEILSVEKAIWVLQSYAENQQKILAERIEGIVTKGLRAVFQDQSLEFKLTYSENKKGDKKKTPEVAMSILYESNGQQVDGDLKDSFGGGLSVVAATLLRIVVVLHLGHRVDPVILLDESLKDLSPDYNSETGDGYRQRMADFLRSLVDETNLQLIMVSHEPEYGRVANVHHRFSGAIGENTNVKSIDQQQEVDNELDEFL